jgi:uncharacterized protein (TIGR00297 family)
VVFPGSAVYVAIILGVSTGLIAFRAGALTADGAAAAAVVGAIIFGVGGLPAALLIILFFVSSSMLTRFRAQQKNALQLGFSKGGRRDAGQVGANGSIAVICMLLYAWLGSSLALMGFVGALAAATADTWGTEIGVLSKKQPRSILDGTPLAPGASGGMTPLGTIASAGGAMVIGLMGIFVLRDWRALPLGLIGGLSGAILDSLLGARWQAMYFCPACEKPTERHPIHVCGAQTIYQRGWPWLNNDGVNFLATCMGAGVSAGLAGLWI